MKRMLIVDDAATVSPYHRSILEPAGYTVEEVMNGSEGLKKALKEPFDLYLVDVTMPKMDGDTFLRELRAQALSQALSIMSSTESEFHDLSTAYAAGANLYLIKPARPEASLTSASLLLGRETS